MGPGQRLVHPAHGPGVVLRVLDGGARLLVAFPSRNNVPWLVRAAELPEAPPVAPPAPASDALEPAAARAALEALRLGVVPRSGLGALTVGREAERARIGALLDAGRGALAVLGPYGAGKSQLLEIARADAIARGWAVAGLSFDAIERPPTHPLRLYAALMADLRVPGSAEPGLLPLLRQLGPRPALLGGPLTHRWLSAALWATCRAEGALPRPEAARGAEGAEATLAEDLRDFVEARSHHDPGALAARLHRAGYRGPRPLGLPDYRTFGQIMAHLLSGLAAWCREAGHHGLLLLLDEAESAARLPPLARAFAADVLRYLALAALPAEALPFSAAALRAGGHPAHQAVPACATPDPPLALIAASTPDPGVEEALAHAIPEDRWLRLPLLGPRHLPQLAARVAALVAAARPGPPPPPGLEAALTQAVLRATAAGQVQTPREAARLLVEAWDLWRWRPALLPRALGLPPGALDADPVTGG
ncbi:MAG: hypothetical protein RL071_2145 [Pseudomonadota bacterium]